MRLQGFAVRFSIQIQVRLEDGLLDSQFFGEKFPNSRFLKKVMRGKICDAGDWVPFNKQYWTMIVLMLRGIDRQTGAKQLESRLLSTFSDSKKQLVTVRGLSAHQLHIWHDLFVESEKRRVIVIVQSWVALSVTQRSNLSTVIRRRVDD